MLKQRTVYRTSQMTEVFNYDVFYTYFPAGRVPQGHMELEHNRFEAQQKVSSIRAAWNQRIIYMLNVIVMRKQTRC